MADDDSSELMTPAEVTRLFRIDIRTLARWAKSGQIKFVRLPSGHRRYRRADIERMLEGK